MKRSTKVLEPFQRAGVIHLTTPLPESKAPHKALAFEMGLGKTPTTVEALKEVDANTALIICPKSVKTSWKKHLVDWKFCEEKDIFVVNSTFDAIPRKARVVIVNFDIVSYKSRPEIRDQLMKMKFNVGVVDECQKLKSIESARANYILGNYGRNIISRCRYRWFLSGTIMMNRIMELYTILKTMAEECIKPYNTRGKFGKRYCGGEAQNFKGASNVEELRKRVIPFIYHVTADQIGNQLPPIVDEDVYFDIGTVNIDGVKMTERDTQTSTLRRAIGITKAPYVAEYLKERLEDSDGKILVFTHTREVSEYLKEQLWRYNAALIYGGMSDDAREAEKQRFIKKKSCRVLIMSLGCGAEAMDQLQYATNEVVFAEFDWSLLNDQAIGRLRRKGQKSEHIRATWCLALGTLDEAEYGTYISKRNVNSRLFAKGEKSMLEQMLERIAVALETIAKQGSSASGVKTAETVKVGKESKTAAPAAASAAKGGAAKSASKSSTKPSASSKPAPKKGSKAAKVEEDDEEEDEEEDEDEDDEEEDEEEEESYTMKDVQKAASAAVKALGGDDEARAAVAKLVKKCGAKVSKEIKEENWAKFIGLCEDAIEAAEEEEDDEDDE